MEVLECFLHGVLVGREAALSAPAAASSFFSELSSAVSCSLSTPTEGGKGRKREEKGGKGRKREEKGAAAASPWNFRANLRALVSRKEK